MKFLNGSITLNVSALSELSSVKTKLHSETLGAGSVKLILASGEELTLDINDFIDVDIKEHCPETGLEIYNDDDLDYTV